MISRPSQVRYEVTSIAQSHFYRHRPPNATQNPSRISRPPTEISRPPPRTGHQAPDTRYRRGVTGFPNARKPRGSFCRNVSPLGVPFPLELRAPKGTVSRWEPQDDLSTVSGALRSYLHYATPFLPSPATKHNPESFPNFATTNRNFATTSTYRVRHAQRATTRENPEGASAETSALSGFPVPPNPVSKHRTAGAEVGNRLRLPQSAVSHEPEGPSDHSRLGRTEVRVLPHSESKPGGSLPPSPEGPASRSDREPRRLHDTPPLGGRPLSEHRPESRQVRRPVARPAHPCCIERLQHSNGNLRKPP